ncbi:SPOR domain-containing protein [Mariprofundus ferrooxydans]|uniref:SPOR domain-containing protein n=1 Tax=Mariprofundus ferrooxydans TaxID=314344 RepID=UPI001F0E184C|nr:SPOR domain-containing protein [Mariprofundus ferrooxydans]
MYLLAALIGAVAIFALLLMFGSPDKPAAPKPADILQSPSAPAAVVTDPEPASKEPAPVSGDTKPEAEPRPIETESQPVDHAIIPADHSGPPWALNLMSLSNLNDKPEHLDQITALGYTPEVIEVNIDGRHWLRLRIKGFATIAAARKAGEQFIDNKEYRTLWIGGY